jgi:predicted Zn finger-like uncharacterized protein
MKIVCEACQAKYSISDDKVRGKAFKIRCKKCSHIIVVRGAGEGAGGTPHDEPSSGSGVEPTSAWHIVVDGEQVGPLSESDIRGRLSRGEISGETFVWREGLADWLKISAVPEFSDGASGSMDSGDAHFGTPAATAVYPTGAAEDAYAAASGG